MARDVASLAPVLIEISSVGTVVEAGPVHYNLIAVAGSAEVCTRQASAGFAGRKTRPAVALFV